MEVRLAPARAALALHPKWIRSLGCAARNPRCSHPCGVKCCRILSFPKALFYNLAALRIKYAFVFIAPNREPEVFQNELRKRVRTSFMGGSFFVRIEEG